MGTDVCGEKARVFTVASEEEERGARLMIESLRAFGGSLSDCPVWVFGPPSLSPQLDGVRAVPLDLDDGIAGYPFAAKVTACARAEEMARADGASLIFLSSACLIVRPPVLLRLESPLGAALRPVHIRNVGSPAAEPADRYWLAVYERIGYPGAPFTVESLVDGKALRPYFNTHLFSVDPREGILGRWLEHFAAMVTDADFQSGPCRDGEHRVFLHQAVFSALIAKTLGRDRISLLPAEYSYPLHFHTNVPRAVRPDSLVELVCPVYEGSYTHPDTLGGIEAGEPLASWLAAHATA